MPGYNTFCHRLLLPLCLLALLAGCSTRGSSDLQGRHFPTRPISAFAETPIATDPALDQTGEEKSEIDEIVAEPDQTSESDQTITLELQGLERLGDWEEGKPAAAAEEQAVYDFPVTINRQVEYYLDFFQNRNRKVFARWLARSGAYLPMIQEQLRQAGLPLDLAYLAMIESGFHQTVRSRARAVGLWQFIRSTGRNYGLQVNSYIDERRNPVKATKAAVEHLADLYETFGSWYLAVAAYNAGEGKISRAIKKYRTDNFWELARGTYLKLETKRYVPQLIAAIIIAKNPEKYGFTEIEYEPPLAFDTIEIPRGMALKAAALACELDVAELWALNRELLKPFAPPDIASYSLNVPAGKKELTLRNLPRVHAVVATKYKTHSVSKGETLGRICKKYGLTKTIILKANDLQTARLEPGQRLRIPYRTTKYELLPEGSAATRFMTAGRGEDFILHKVRPGETVSGLAKLYNVPAQLIAGWNDLKDVSRIKAGQQLAIYIERDGGILSPTASADRLAANVAQDTAPPQTGVGRQSLSAEQPRVEEALRQELAAAGKEVVHYRVLRGDSLWTIARKFKTTTAAIRNWNDLENTVIHPGSDLLIAAAAEGPVAMNDSQSGEDDEAAGKELYYQVRGGDSLWTIARKFNLSTDKIRLLNHLKDDIIHPGNRLLVKIAEAGV